jgi:hypothetical protein
MSSLTSLLVGGGVVLDFPLLAQHLTALRSLELNTWMTANELRSLSTLQHLRFLRVKTFMPQEDFRAVATSNYTNLHVTSRPDVEDIILYRSDEFSYRNEK